MVVCAQINILGSVIAKGVVDIDRLDTALQVVDDVVDGRTLRIAALAGLLRTVELD